MEWVVNCPVCGVPHIIKDGIQGTGKTQGCGRCSSVLYLEYAADGKLFFDVVSRVGQHQEADISEGPEPESLPPLPPQEKRAARDTAMRKAEQILRDAGIEIKICGCGCCGSPTVSLRHNGETILEDEENCELNTWGKT